RAVECMLLERVPDERSAARWIPMDARPRDGGPRSEQSGAGRWGPRSEECWEALVHPGQKLPPGAEVVFEGSRTLRARMLERKFHGRRVIRLWTEDGSTVDDATES